MTIQTQTPIKIDKRNTRLIFMMREIRTNISDMAAHSSSGEPSWGSPTIITSTNKRRTMKNTLGHPSICLIR